MAAVLVTAIAIGAGSTAAASRNATDRRGPRCRARRLPGEGPPEAASLRDGCGCRSSAPTRRAGRSRSASRSGRAADRSRPSLGTIFAVEGGPGYGSIAQRPLLHPHARAACSSAASWCTVDMRGTGHSRAIDCPAAPGGPRLGRPRRRPVRARARSDASAPTGPPAAADDLDAVREALGLERIELYGDSYGTYPRPVLRVSPRREPRRAGPRQRLSAARRERLVPEPDADRASARWRSPAGARTAVTARRGHGSPRVVERCARPRAAPGRCSTRSASAGYEPPLRYYTEINDGDLRYLRGDRRPYRRLIDRAYDGGYGHYRATRAATSSRSAATTTRCSGTRPRPRASARAQREAAIRALPEGRLPAVHPGARSRSRASPPIASASTGRSPPSSTSRRRRPAPRRPRSRRWSSPASSTTSPARPRRAAVAADFPDAQLRVVRNAGHIPSLYGGRYPARDWVRRFLRRH